MTQANLYTVGGTVQAGSGVYISRQADGELLALCRQGIFAYVLTARQMGKSSLMVRTAEQLGQEGIRSAILDLTQLGVQLTAEQWYLGLLVAIEEQLALDTEVVAWWQARAHLGMTQRLSLFFEQVLLKEVAEPVVIFVDEIDTTLSLAFTDDFFAAIRSFYVARARRPEFKRLSFVLIGVATPGDLIRDPQRTPFNIGQRVELTDFTSEEALPLAAGLGLAQAEAQQVLGWVLHWTGGHPYLTQRLCRVMAEQAGGSRWSEAAVERTVASTFLGAMSEQDNNLQFVRDMLSKRGPDQVEVLTTYDQVRRGKPPVWDEEQSQVKSHLKLAGVVCRAENAVLYVRNRINRTVFDRKWVREHLPRTWWDRIIESARREILVLLPVILSLLLLSLLMTGLAGYAWQQRDIAQQQTQLAKQESQRAQQQTQLAKREGERAQQQFQVALEQRQVAQKQTQLAQKNSQEANKQRQAAEKQTRVADWQRQEADRQRQRAEDQTRLAKKQRLEAELREQGAVATNLLRVKPVDGVLLAIRATGQSLSEFQKVFPPIQSSLLDAIDASRERNLFQGHERYVYSVAFSPDGQRIVSGSGDNTVRLWDLKGQAIGQPFRGHQGSVYSVAFSPDGQRIVSGSDDNTLRLWDLKGQAIGQPFRGHERGVWSVAFSPVGQRFVSGSDDNTLRLWDLKGQAIGQPFRGHESYVRSVAFSADGQRIVSGSADNPLQLWQGGTWRDWLRIDCNRLRDHPVLRNPQTEVAKGARETCQKYVPGWR